MIWRDCNKILATCKICQLWNSNILHSFPFLLTIYQILSSWLFFLVRAFLTIHLFPPKKCQHHPNQCRLNNVNIKWVENDDDHTLYTCPALSLEVSMSPRISRFDLVNDDADETGESRWKRMSGGRSGSSPGGPGGPICNKRAQINFSGPWENVCTFWQYLQL